MFPEKQTPDRNERAGCSLGSLLRVRPEGEREAHLREKPPGRAVSTKSSANPQGALKLGRLPRLVPS